MSVTTRLVQPISVDPGQTVAPGHVFIGRVYLNRMYLYLKLLRIMYLKFDADIFETTDTYVCIQIPI